jgi:hypothetical protein
VRVLDLEVVENLFREFIQKQTIVVKIIPCEKLCNDALDLLLLKSLWENIMQDCSQETSKQIKKLCLENIVKLYSRVRSFSYAKDYISNFKMQQKAVKSKSLRKELKRKNEDIKYLVAKCIIVVMVSDLTLTTNALPYANL